MKIDEEESPHKYNYINKYMYNEVVPKFRTCGGLINNFSIAIELHQEYVLSLLLFIIVMNDFTELFRMKYFGIFYLLIILS